MSFFIHVAVLASIYSLVATSFNINYRTKSFLDFSFIGYIYLIPFLLDRISIKDNLLLFFMSMFVIWILLFIFIYVINRFIFGMLRPLGPTRSTLGSICLLIILLVLPAMVTSKSVQRSTSLDSTILDIRFMHLDWFSLVSIFSMIVLLGIIVFGSKTHIGYSVRAYMSDNAQAQTNGISANYIELVTSLVVSLCAVVVGTLFSTQSIVNNDQLIFIIMGSLCVVYLGMRKSLLFIFIYSIALAFLVKLVSANISLVSSLYRQVASIFNFDTTQNFTGDLAFALVPFIVLIVLSFTISKRDNYG